MPPLIKLVQGDITKLPVDALVVTVDSQLTGATAVYQAAGPELLEACKRIYQDQGAFLPGYAALTPGFDLCARFVIHVVAPIWPESQPGEVAGVGILKAEEEFLVAKEQLYMAYQHSLELTCEQGCHSLAFPCISTGAFCYPKEIAAHIALTAIKHFCLAHPEVKETLQEIYLVCSDDENHQVYCEIFS